MKGYVGLCRDKRLQKAECGGDEGEQQGAQERSCFLFCIADAINRETNILLNKQDGFLMIAGMDIYISMDRLN